MREEKSGVVAAGIVSQAARWQADGYIRIYEKLQRRIFTEGKERKSFVVAVAAAARV